MIFCSKCGAELIHGAKFCPKCGQLINAVSQQQVNNKERQFVDHQEEQTTGVKNNFRIIKWLSAIVLILLVCLFVYKFVGGSESKSSLFTTQIVTFKESATVESFNVEVEINIDYPISGNKELLNSIYSFVVETLTDVYTFEEVSANPHYDGDFSDGKKVVDFYGKAKLEELKPNGMGEARIFINKVHETDAIVSYQVHMSGNYGGPGISTKYGITFDKRDGKQIPVIKDHKNKKFEKYLIDNVINSIDSNNIDMLEETELKSHPFPKYAPFITKDGVCFIYQKYEIGSGALGEVETVIPINAISDYLTDDVCSLIDGKKQD